MNSTPLISFQQNLDGNKMNSIKYNLNETLSLEANTRKKAENTLIELSKDTTFINNLLYIIANENGLATKQSASLYLKYFIKRNWAIDSNISSLDRNKIKSSIVLILVKSHKLVQNTLSDILTIICKYDFPKNWGELLPSCVKLLRTSDINIINGILSVFDSVLIKFTRDMRTPESDRELEYCGNNIIAPLTEIFTILNNSISSEAMMNPMYLCVRILKSLIYQELLADIENRASTWFENLYKVLIYEPSYGVEQKNEVNLDCIKAKIFEVLVIFSDKYEDCVVFKDSQTKFVEQTWKILLKAKLDAEYDELVISGMIFLTSVIKKPWNKSLFKREAIQILICKQIILPNIKLRDTDINDFELSPMDFYMRDMEKADNYTRRRISIDLIQSLVKVYADDVSKIIITYINSINERKNINWIEKDALLFLIIAVVVQEYTERQGAVKIMTNFNVNNFLYTHVLPELTNTNFNETPILKADCIKVLLIFRNSVPDNLFQSLLPLFNKYIDHPSIIVHTYAAKAIEKLLILKLDNGSFRLTLNDLKPHINNLFNSLFNTLKSTNYNNQFILKSISFLCFRSESETNKYVNNLLNLLFETLNYIIKNPVNADFNHYLFETISAIIDSTCKENNESIIFSFENKLFPIFERLLNMDDCDDFYAYIFQILTQILSHRKNITTNYSKIFPILLNPELWIEISNAKPLSSLLIEFLKKSGEEIVRMNKINALLGVFQKLLSQKMNDYYAFSILVAIVEFIPLNHLTKYLLNIFKLICIKLEKDRSSRFINRFNTFICIFITLHNFELLEKCINEIQNNMCNMIIDKIILPNINNLRDSSSRNQCAIGLTCIICNEKYINHYSESQWGKILENIINLIELTSNEKNGTIEDLENLERTGYSAQYSNLAFARIKEYDPLKKIGNCRLFLSKKLVEISRKMSVKIIRRIENEVSKRHQTVLSAYLKDSNLMLI